MYVGQARQRKNNVQELRCFLLGMVCVCVSVSVSVCVSVCVFVCVCVRLSVELCRRLGGGREIGGKCMLGRLANEKTMYRNSGVFYWGLLKCVCGCEQIRKTQAEPQWIVAQRLLSALTIPGFT